MTAEIPLVTRGVVEGDRIPVTPLAVVPAPGETPEEAIRAIIDLDDALTDAIERGDLVLAEDGQTYIPNTNRD